MPNEFNQAVQLYFGKHLLQNKGSSKQTVLLYRQIISELIDYIENKFNKKDYQINLFKDITVELIEGYLNWLEDSRGNSVSSRNIKLAAIRSFTTYASRIYPEFRANADLILGIPRKAAPEPKISYLKQEGVDLLLAQPDLKKPEEERDYVILLLFIATGLRVSELINIKYIDVNLTSPATITICGKGNKRRLIKLYKPVVKVLNKYLERIGYNLDKEENRGRYLFTSHEGEQYTRQGINYLVSKYATRARKVDPNLIPRDLSPHKLRHTAAMLMLDKGLDIMSIRDALGHTSVQVTERYAKLHDEYKSKALEEYQNQIGLNNQDTETNKEKETDADIKTWLKDFGRRISGK